MGLGKKSDVPVPNWVIFVVMVYIASRRSLVLVPTGVIALIQLMLFFRHDLTLQATATAIVSGYALLVVFAACSVTRTLYRQGELYEYLLMACTRYRFAHWLAKRFVRVEES